jgi:hypothetical protein
LVKYYLVFKGNLADLLRKKLWNDKDNPDQF